MRWKIKANQRSWRFTCQQNRKFGCVQLTGSKRNLFIFFFFPCIFLCNHSYTVTMRTLKSLTLITRILYNFYANSLKTKIRDNRYVEENRQIKFTFSPSLFYNHIWFLVCLSVMWNGYDRRRKDRERDI